MRPQPAWGPAQRCMCRLAQGARPRAALVGSSAVPPLARLRCPGGRWSTPPGVRQDGRAHGGTSAHRACMHPVSGSRAQASRTSAPHALQAGPTMLLRPCRRYMCGGSRREAGVHAGRTCPPVATLKTLHLEVPGLERLLAWPGGRQATQRPECAGASSREDPSPQRVRRRRLLAAWPGQACAPLICACSIAGRLPVGCGSRQDHPRGRLGVQVLWRLSWQCRVRRKTCPGLDRPFQPAQTIAGAAAPCAAPLLSCPRPLFGASLPPAALSPPLRSSPFSPPLHVPRAARAVPGRQN